MSVSFNHKTSGMSYKCINKDLKFLSFYKASETEIKCIVHFQKLNEKKNNFLTLAVQLFRNDRLAILQMWLS